MGRPGVRERLRYRFDNTMSRGTPALVGLLALGSLLLVIVVGLVAAAFSEDGLTRTLWMSLLRTLDPGTMGGDEGNGVFLFLMLTVTVGGIFVVAALIGVLNAGLTARLDELRKGRSRVAESGHTVVLGWSEQVFTVVSELVQANAAGARECVAILADRERVAMEDELRARVGDTGKTRVVCRTGRPTEPTDLDILSLESAKSIVVLSPEHDDADVHVIKVLLALSNRGWPTRRPHVFAGVSVAQNLPAAQLAGGSYATVVDAEDISARVLVQTCRQAGLSVVCSELLGFDGGEMYMRQDPTMAGMTFGEALYAYENATVLGLYRAGDTTAVNPPMGTRIEPTDQMIVLAEDQSIIRLAQRQPTIASDAITAVAPTEPASERILLLGWNRRATKVIELLDQYVAPGSLLQVAADGAHERADLDGLGARLQNALLSYEECDVTERVALESLNVGSFDSIGVLADDRLPGDHADSRTLVTLLHLRDMQSRLRERYSIVTEMNDERNRRLAEVTRADDFVVSGKLTSLLLTQLSENRHLRQVFNELFDPAGSEIQLQPAGDFVRAGARVNFATLIEAARRLDETALGYRIMAQAWEPPNYGVILNPDKEEPFVLDADDQVIVLSQGLRDAPGEASPSAPSSKVGTAVER